MDNAHGPKLRADVERTGCVAAARDDGDAARAQRRTLLRTRQPAPRGQLEERVRGSHEKNARVPGYRFRLADGPQRCTTC
jgi:hypothetical protein